MRIGTVAVNTSENSNIPSAVSVPVAVKIWLALITYLKGKVSTSCGGRIPDKCFALAIGIITPEYFYSASCACISADV